MDATATLAAGGLLGDLKYALIGTGIGMVIVLIRHMAASGRKEIQEEAAAATPTLKERCRSVHDAWKSMKAGSLDAEGYRNRKVGLLQQCVRQARAEESGALLLGYVEHLRQLGAVSDAEFASVRNAVEPAR